MTTSPLAAYLAAQDKSQASFAALAGLDHAVVSRLCAGKRKPSLATALTIERATRGAVPVKAWRVTK